MSFMEVKTSYPLTKDLKKERERERERERKTTVEFRIMLKNYDR